MGRPRLFGLVVAAAVVAALVLHFGKACLPGWWIVDTTPASDSYFLATIYERWAAQIAGGHLPVWFPEFAAGYPVHAAWMYGLAYPPLALFLVLPPETAWTWLAILHAAFGAAGMFTFLRDEEHGDAAAATGAVVFALSGFMVGRVAAGHLNLIMPLAWAPWVLLWTLRCVRGHRSAAAMLGLCAGIGLIAGHVQVWFYVAPVVAAFAVMEMKRRAAFRSALPRLAVAAAIAVGISAIQWLPTLELVRLGGTLHPDERTLSLGSATGRDLVAQFWPRWLTGPASVMRHEFLGVCGPLAVLALPAAFIAPRPGRWFWLGVAILGLLLATGTNNGLGTALSAIPPFGLGRVPGRGLMLVALAAAPLAANLVSIRWKAPGWIAPVVFGVSALATAAPVEAVRSDFYEYDWSQQLGPGADRHRVHVADGRYPLLERFGIRTLREVCPVLTPGYRKLIELSEEPTAWWFDVGTQIAVPWTGEPPASPTEMEALTAGATVTAHRTPGRCAFFEAAGVSPSDGNVFESMDRSERFLAVHRAGDDDQVTAWGRHLPDAVRQVPSPSYGELEFDVGSWGTGWVFVSESWYPGWQWTRDNGATWRPAERANLTFLAVQVHDAEHVRLRYSPTWLVPSIVACAASLAAAIVLLLRARRSNSERR